MTVTVTPEVMQDMAQDAYRQRVMIVSETQMHVAPWLHTDEGWQESRLKWAIEAVCAGQVRDTGLAYAVQGDTAVYAIPKGSVHRCPCPAAHYGASQHCKHRVALELYRRVQQAYPETPALMPRREPGDEPDDDTLGNGYPVDDETLPLPLPPVTVDERLAAPVTPLSQECHTLVTPLSQGSQEDPMPADAYIPEPEMDEAPVAVLEPLEPLPSAPVKIPREFTVNIKGKMHVLYTGLVIAARHDGLVSLSADWTYNDAELSLAHAVCTFADGRRYEESGDASPSNVSKGISPHFRRVALTRAKARCLRDALGIAECSVEEMEDTASAVPDMTQQPSDEDLKRRLWQRIKVLAPDVAREEVGRWVHEQTTLALVPKHYAAILAKLEAGR